MWGESVKFRWLETGHIPFFSTHNYQEEKGRKTYRLKKDGKHMLVKCQVWTLDFFYRGRGKGTEKKKKSNIDVTEDH